MTEAAAGACEGFGVVYVAVLAGVFTVAVVVAWARGYSRGHDAGYDEGAGDGLEGRRRRGGGG